MPWPTGTRHIQPHLTTGIKNPICILGCWPTREGSVLPLYLHTPPLLCARLPFFISVFPRCSLRFELLCATFTGRTVELVEVCVCLQCLQMSSLGKVNITWAVELLELTTSLIPRAPGGNQTIKQMTLFCASPDICHFCDAAILVATGVCRGCTAVHNN